MYNKLLGPKSKSSCRDARAFLQNDFDLGLKIFYALEGYLLKILGELLLQVVSTPALRSVQCTAAGQQRRLPPAMSQNGEREREREKAFSKNSLHPLKRNSQTS